MVTECCSESRMRSRTSRGVPEWSGGKDLYMGSHVWSPEKFRVLSVTYRDHWEGPGGPPSGATNLGGQHGPSVGGDQPQVGWCTPHKGPRRLGFGEGAHQPTWGWSPPTLGPCSPPGPVAPLGGPPGPSRWSRYITDKTRNFSGDQNRTSYI